MASIPRWLLKTVLSGQYGPLNNLSNVVGYSADGLIYSEGHPRRNGHWVGGGGFYVEHNRLTHKGAFDFKHSLYNGTYNQTNKMCSVVGSPNGVPANVTQPRVSWKSQQDTLASNYATGFARARPGNPKASVGQFVAELRQLPTLPFRKAFFIKKKGRRFYTAIPFTEIPRRLLNETLSFRNLGSEYLNVQFGWKPFVNDLRQMYNLWYTIDKQMAQIIRENGKSIRRRATVLNELTVEQGGSVSDLQVISRGKAYETPAPEWKLQSALPSTRTFGSLAASPSLGKTTSAPFVDCRGAPPNLGWTGSSTTTVTRTTRERIWFSGKFRYYIPDVSSSQWNKAARLALFGALPTPDLIWNLLPWSWLIDWFSNVGDVVSNASPNAVGFPLIEDSYVMRHYLRVTEWQVDTTVRAPTLSSQDWKAGSHTLVSTDYHETKARMRGGNPFGLNVKLSDLSGSQFAILAALGMSRGRVK